MNTKAAEKALDILESYQPAPLPNGAAEKMQDIIKTLRQIIIFIHKKVISVCQ
ncbi:MAG: hypothetical protein U0M15_09830 [Bacillota bacterium]|nr:hypothetical protein [Bacillota bacterium]